jgi:hypothetical protein
MTTRRQVDAFLERYPPDVREIAFATRRLLEDALPGVEETIDPSAKLIGYRYGPGYKGLLCTLIPSQKEVKLGIFRGSELPDPKHLLTGAGKVHRHVPLRRLADLRQPGLKPLLTQALSAWRSRNADLA